MRVHLGREGLDIVEPAQTKRRQDIVHLARNKPLLELSSDQFYSMQMRTVANNLGVHFDPELLMVALGEQALLYISLQLPSGDVWERFAGR